MIQNLFIKWEDSVLENELIVTRVEGQWERIDFEFWD